MVARFLTLKTSIIQWQSIACKDKEVFKKIREFRLDEDDWEQLLHLVKLLYSWKEATLLLESSLHPTYQKCGRLILILLYHEPSLVYTE